MVGRKFGPWPDRFSVVSRTHVACCILSLLLGAHLSDAYAVGTWGGGEPPSSDDMYVGNGPWWLLPVALFALLVQIFIVGSWPAQTFCIFVTVVTGVTIANRFGDAAGWISGGLTALVLYRWLLAEEKTNKPALADNKELTQDKRSNHSEADRADKRDQGDSPIKKEASATKDSADDQQAYTRRISGLRERIDKEAGRYR